VAVGEVFTFVGTGLDIKRQDASTATSDTIGVTVDGTSVGNLSTSGSTSPRYEKIVSGLPYGTHTVQFTRSASAANSVGIAGFMVYGPSTPAIPSGAIALADYYVLANLVANSTAALTTISTGVLRKTISTKEAVFTGTGWSVGSVDAVNGPSGYTTNTTVSGDAVSYTFYGTGFDFRFFAATNRSANIQLALQSLSTGGSLLNLTSANFPTAVSSGVYGGAGSFSLSTGILSQNGTNTAGEGLVISGLPLGLYTLKMTNNTVNVFEIDTLDIITPIHSPKSNAPGDLQNTLSVGSNGIGDSRVFSDLAVKSLSNWSQAIGVASSPSTTVTSFVPCPDMTVLVKTSGNPLFITYGVEFNLNAIGGQAGFQVYVDGVPVGTQRHSQVYASGVESTTGDTMIIPVSPGTHLIQLYWRIAAIATTIVASDVRRTLTAREI
jgi:hypothetical protein